LLVLLSLQGEPQPPHPLGDYELRLPLSWIIDGLKGHISLVSQVNGGRIAQVEEKMKQLEEENNHLRGQLTEYSGDVKLRLDMLEKQRDELMALLKKKTT